MRASRKSFDGAAERASGAAESDRVRPRKVLLVAGEASGDVHAADLVRELRSLAPDVEVSGIAGGHARAEAMHTFVDIAEIATFGLTELAEKGRAIVRAYRRVSRELAEGRPDLLVLIDFPEFNLALAGRAKRLGVPVFYYVSPQVWAWRKGRVRKILRRVDRLAAVFPFEPAVYGNPEKVSFVGHPLLDKVRATSSREETLARHGLDPGRRLVTLLPGSRRREIEMVLPEMIGAARILSPGRNLQVALALAPTLSRPLAAELVAGADIPIPIVENDTYNLIRAADLVLVTSGTATLETALLERPMVIVYRVSRITFFAARLLVDVPAIGMPNLIAGRPIVPELLQRDARAARIAEEAAAVLDDPERAREMSEALAGVRDALGPGGAAGRAARLALECLR